MLYLVQPAILLAIILDIGKNNYNAVPGTARFPCHSCTVGSY
jgi:hypothetical protein